jgi:DNA-binding transcriptional LysR family regulator
LLKKAACKRPQGGFTELLRLSALRSASSSIEFGALLLDRTRGHAFRLTAAGEVLTGYARGLISLRDAAAAAMEAVRNVERGQLCIGANQSIGEYLLPQLTATLRVDP